MGVKPKPAARGLRTFYGSPDLYSRLFVTNHRRDVQSCVPTQLGWKTDGSACLDSPTKVAVDGLIAVFSNDAEVARAHAEWLVQHSERRGQALVFPFRWDYESFWPYKLKAPWLSAITQGLALGLFSYLYESTRDVRWRKTATAAFHSYLIPKSAGGFADPSDATLALQEYPTTVPTHVLNGAAVALLALHDYWRIFDDRTAGDMFFAGVRWFEDNIDRYTVVSGDYPRVVSAYSLAPKRHELLCRLIGDAAADIYSISLNRGTDVLEQLLVGSLHDSDMNAPLYVWDNPNYMTWGKRQVRGERPFRRLVPDQGEYRHAPFSMAVTGEPTGLRLCIRAAAVGDAGIQVQCYSGKEYLPVGRLASISSKAYDYQFDLRDPAVIAALTSSQEPPVDDRYLDDNYELMFLVASLGRSNKIAQTANRWIDSGELVPPSSLNRRPTDLVGQGEVVLRPLAPPSEEALHTEHPALVTTPAGRTLLHYSASENGRHWRLFRAARGTDGKWVREGRLLADEDLPFSGNYCCPNIVTLHSAGRAGIMLAFAASSAPGHAYDAGYIIQSADGESWGKPTLAVADTNVLDPLILEEDDILTMYYIAIDGWSSNIMRTLSLNGEKWTKPSSVYGERRGPGGLTSLASFRHMGYRLFLVGANVSRSRHEWRVLCRSPALDLVAVPNGVIHIDDAGQEEANPRLFGMTFANNDSCDRVYYSWSKSSAADVETHIRSSPVTVQVLDRLYLYGCVQ